MARIALLDQAIPGAVPVAAGTGCGGRQDGVAGEPLGNRVQTLTGQVLGEDALHYWASDGIGFQLM